MKKGILLLVVLTAACLLSVAQEIKDDRFWLSAPVGIVFIDGEPLYDSDFEYFVITIKHGTPRLKLCMSCLIDSNTYKSDCKEWTFPRASLIKEGNYLAIEDKKQNIVYVVFAKTGKEWAMSLKKELSSYYREPILECER